VTGALGAAEFERLMRPLGPFERAPRIAIAVSGGIDSLALMLCAARWASAQGGRAIGITVDHGLRPEAADETRRVAGWLRHRKLRHVTLRWTGSKPTANLQAEARAARYRLLEDWCRASGVLHLLLAHQIEDQAETLLLRLARGSGVDGLAAMAPITETAHVRRLRPLLGVSRARLLATLERAHQPWIEDPSNRDERFGRVRWRAMLPVLEREGLGPARLAETAARQARARRTLEAETAKLLARAAAVDPAGFAILARDPIVQAPAEIGRRALGAVLRCIGGGDYAPRYQRLDRLYREIVEDGLPAARTLGGCRILRLKHGAADRLLVCREPVAVESAAPIAPGARVRWDNRFECALGRRPKGAKGTLRLAGLSARDWAVLVRRDPGLRQIVVPSAARLGLPTLCDRSGPLALLVAGGCRISRAGRGKPGRQDREAGTVSVHVAFRPGRPLAGGPVTGG
jgi:tRNA(Ile)-lysidine synthase